MVVEAEEVKSILALGQAGDSRLIGVQLQPEMSEDLADFT
jgi:hypothetical protein